MEVRKNTMEWLRWEGNGWGTESVATSNFRLCLCLFIPFTYLGVERAQVEYRAPSLEAFVSFFFPSDSLLVLGSLYIALGSSDWSGVLPNLSVSSLKSSGAWLLIPKPLRLLWPKIFSLINISSAKSFKSIFCNTTVMILFPLSAPFNKGNDVGL